MESGTGLKSPSQLSSISAAIIKTVSPEIRSRGLGMTDGKPSPEMCSEITIQPQNYFPGKIPVIKLITGYSSESKATLD